MSANALAAALQFIEWTPDEASRSAAQALVAAGDALVLQRWFGGRLQFGTAGLRGPMHVGYRALNQLVILQTTQGLVRYLIDAPNACAVGVDQRRERGVIVGFDGRYNSKEYARLVAAVLLHERIRVYFLPEMTATPFVPFGVLQLGCAAGIMITASHNPKQDNGYKLYWENGAQIIPPHDQAIAASIEANLEPWTSYSFDSSDELLENPTDRLYATYDNEIMKRYCHFRGENPAGPVKVIYTAMHGVGFPHIKRAFTAFDLPTVIPVKQQVASDPEFPTVPFPNPEEGDALALAIQTARLSDATLILANDPDADRLAVAERDTRTDTIRIFDGNEIAALLADWIWMNYRAANPDTEPSRALMVTTTASSKYLQAMAKQEGFQFAETLTGFKWIANRAIELEKSEGLEFLFAYEVEIGFLIGNLSWDKDGIRTASAFAEMANYLRIHHGISCAQRLIQLQNKYGHFAMKASYFFCEQRSLLEVFHGLRTGGPNSSYVAAAGLFRVSSVRDITTGFDSSEADKKSRLPIMPADHMITFRFEEGSICTIRNSGTEPKLKYYVECSDKKNRATAESRLALLTESVVKHWLRPDYFELRPPGSKS